MKITATVLMRDGITSNFAKEAPLEVREVDLAPPGRGEVRIRMAAAGVCHSDLSVINGTRPRPLPMVLGHEASGYVENVGVSAFATHAMMDRRSLVKVEHDLPAHV